MIDVGASGAQAEIPFSLFDNTTGAPVTGHAWIAGEVKVRVPGGSFVNATIGNIVEWGNGQYALQLTALQTASPGKVSIYVLVTGAQADYGPEEIKSSVATDIVAALMAHEHDTGASFEGLCIRLDALIAGKATGLNAPFARYFKRDGTTAAIVAAQDTAAGTRGTGDISGSE
jgi:hypothetical protein